jgi:hypothetical protein
MIIQKVYLIHDWLYASKSLIPAYSLDGKDYPSEYYIITQEPITEAQTMGIYMYDSIQEAIEGMEDN